MIVVIAPIVMIVMAAMIVVSKNPCP